MFTQKVRGLTKAAASPTSRLSPRRPPLATRPFGGGAVAHALMLQRSTGNEATLRQLTQQATSLTRNEAHRYNEVGADPAIRTAGGPTPGIARDSSNIPLFPSDWADRPQLLSPRAATLLPGAMQPKLVVGEVNDSLEHEADRVADQVMHPQERGPSISPIPKRLNSIGSASDDSRTVQTWSAAGSRMEMPGPSIVHATLATRGRPLDAPARQFLETRFRYSLPEIRIHDDAQAACSAAVMGARACSVGQDIVFGAAEYRRDEPSGMWLLAHEVAHVVQQSASEGAQPSALALTQACHHVQRQVIMPTAPTSSIPTFSVNQATYLNLIDLALGQMSGRLVESETLVTTIVPILQAMLTRVTWKDQQGVTHGGGPIRHTLPDGSIVNLQLILNDQANPLKAGEFVRIGATDAELEIFIRPNVTSDDLAETLYHEALHMVSWLINRPKPALSLRSGGRSGPAAAVASLDLARLSRQIDTVRIWLDTLAQSVNRRRAASAQIGASALDAMARWLVEEVEVRAETEVFRLAQSTQQAVTARGPAIIIGTGTNWQVNSTMVDRYVFDFSGTFAPTDRAGLTADDQKTLNTLMQILEGIFQNRVRRRFSPSPYLVGRGIPRAQVQWQPPPLAPPSSFGPPPLP